MKLIALLTGTALALVPTGTAFAGDTGQGHGYGNCSNSSAGGERVPVPSDLRPAGSKGNGGVQALRGVGCTTEPPTTEPPTTEPAPPTEPIDPGFGLN